MTTTEQSNGIPDEIALDDDDAKGRSIIEAVLTASDTPVTAGQLVDLVGGDAGAKQIRQYVDDLNEVYVKTGRAFRITEVAGGFQFSVHHEFAPWIRRLLQEKPVRLSQAALEVLSIVAFKQPITKAEVEHIRGVASDGVLRHLMEKGLVRIAGRSDGVGRPLLYGTARDFLKFFGLKTLADLPKVREVEDLLKEEAEGGVQDAPAEGEESGMAESAQGGSEVAEGDPDAAEEAPVAEVPSEEEIPEVEDSSVEDTVASDATDQEDSEDASVDDEADSDDSVEEEQDTGEAEQISGEGGDRIAESV